MIGEVLDALTRNVAASTEANGKVCELLYEQSLAPVVAARMCIARV